MHYGRWQRHGEPTYYRPRKTLEERFWEKVDKSGDCWMWMACRDQRGYGQFALGAGQRDNSTKAHRLAWEIVNRTSVPKGMCVCHTCDNPPCVNPAHLFLASHSENMLDKAAKGRAYSMPRAINHMSKLTPEQVTELKARYAAGGVTQYQLAEEFGMTQPGISYIIRH